MPRKLARRSWSLRPVEHTSSFWNSSPEAGGPQVAITDVGLERQTERDTHLLAEAERVAASADVAVVVVGANEQAESEGWDRTSLELPSRQDELVRRVRAANPRTVVVLNCGSPMLLPWLEEVPATLLAWYPGQEAGDAIVDVLLGDVDPGGRMPTTWAWQERDTPAFLHYPGRLTSCATARSCTLATVGTTPEVWSRWSRSVTEVPTPHSNGASRR